jgi:hypothetical protein
MDPRFAVRVSSLPAATGSFQCTTPARTRSAFAALSAGLSVRTVLNFFYDFVHGNLIIFFVSSAPSEAPIEVVGGKCNGDKDVNFELTGFTVSGQVASDKSCKGSAGGVAGTSVTLSDSEGKAVATAVSQQGGAFVFENIAPGSYKVAARGDATSKAVAVQWGPSKVAEPITISSSCPNRYQLFFPGRTATQQRGFCYRLRPSVLFSSHFSHRACF